MDEIGVGSGTLILLAAAVYLAPALIEMLGPVAGDKESIRTAKRQISSVISSFLAVGTSILADSGLEVSEGSLSTMLVVFVLSKAGIQGAHDGYWTDKDLPSLRGPKSAAHGDV